MFAGIYKWVGVVVCTLVAYSLFLKYITVKSFSVGQTTLTYAAIVAAIVFVYGARLTLKKSK